MTKNKRLLGKSIRHGFKSRSRYARFEKFMDYPGQCDSFMTNSGGTNSFTNRYYIPKDNSDIGKTLRICLFWMSTDMFLGGNTAEAEGSVSQPNLISMQLRARAGSNFWEQLILTD